jgi:hypothetical protein
MSSCVDSYIMQVLLNRQNIAHFYKTLITTHYYCEDDFKLKTNYAILLFIDTLFLDKHGFKELNVPHTILCDLYQYIADNRLKIFQYITYKASAQNDYEGLQSIVNEFRKDNWITLFGYYTYNKTLDLLNSKETGFDIKNKIYAIICSLKETQAEDAEDAEQVCDACENECSICLYVMDPTSTITTLCGHSFHTKCLYPMFDDAVKKNTIKPKISCPLCRADVFIKSKITFTETTHY